MAESGGGDYDEGADRIEQYIPPDVTERGDIRDYIDDELDRVKGDAVDRFTEIIAERRAPDRDDEPPETGEPPDISDAPPGIYYDEGAGRWRDEDTGHFTESPE